MTRAARLPLLAQKTYPLRKWPARQKVSRVGVGVETLEYATSKCDLGEIPKSLKYIPFLTLN